MRRIRISCLIGCLVGFVVVSGCIGVGSEEGGKTSSGEVARPATSSETGDVATERATSVSRETNQSQVAVSRTSSSGNETISAAFTTGSERVPVTLEVANSPSEREHGLMHRQSLPRNHGMLFVFDTPRPVAVWMKNTTIPLDIIFVRANGTITNIEHASPEPNVNDSEKRRYSADVPGRYFVEMNRGFANRTGLEPGNKLVLGDKRLTTERRDGTDGSKSNGSG
ncbi:DUF192 domain-containing protein [Haladaptatus sp. CMAA 1911]|uniref:DUF192 domain-containing protein n=1 Tax=unclassified Haladaptatus TaxID=2622732 RepID=UPI003754260E